MYEMYRKKTIKYQTAYNSLFACYWCKLYFDVRWICLNLFELCNVHHQFNVVSETTVSRLKSNVWSNIEIVFVYNASLELVKSSQIYMNKSIWMEPNSMNNCSFVVNYWIAWCESGSTTVIARYWQKKDNTHWMIFSSERT